MGSCMNESMHMNMRECLGKDGGVNDGPQKKMTNRWKCTSDREQCELVAQLIDSHNSSD